MQENDDPNFDYCRLSKNDIEELKYPCLPSELQYLLEPALHYGRQYAFDDSIQWFVENADESDKEILATLAEHARLSGDYHCLMHWMDEIKKISDHFLEHKYPSHMVEQNVDIRKQRIKMNMKLTSIANEKLHHVDMYFLFGLMDACDLRFE